MRTTASLDGATPSHITNIRRGGLAADTREQNTQVNTRRSFTESLAAARLLGDSATKNLSACAQEVHGIITLAWFGLDKAQNLEAR